MCRIEQIENAESGPFDLFDGLRSQSLLLLGVSNSKLPYGFFDRLLRIRSFNVADQCGRRGADVVMRHSHIFLGWDASTCTSYTSGWAQYESPS
jgi:hypothetical protein